MAISAFSVLRTGSLLAALLLLPSPAVAAEGGLSAPELEEAAEVARRAASAALRGQPHVLFEALDIDGILEPHLGSDVWQGLTAKQRETLRTIVRQTFAGVLAPPRSTPGEIAWSSAREDAGGVSVFLGIRFGDRWLKSRWLLRRATQGGWRIEDVTLSDPGVSLAEQSLRALGPQPVWPRDRRRQARQETYPRLAILAAIGLIVVLVYPRLAPAKRTLLLLTAAAPTLLFVIDGVLAVRRALAERYAIASELPQAPWERWVRLAREAQREGRDAEAELLWEHALGAGAAAAPVAYERGLAARDRGDRAAAERRFQRALAATPPAPGAFRELALLALAEGRAEEARAGMARYLEATGPDPDALSVEAVIESNLRSPQKALEAIRQARDLVGEGPRGAELEARVRARMADAPGAVSALRELEPAGRIDRDSLRADPAYLPIANDPAWIAFLSESPAPPAAAATPPAR